MFIRLWHRWKIRRLEKKLARVQAQVVEEKRLHKSSRKLAGLSICQLRRIVRRQPQFRPAAEAELARRLFRPVFMESAIRNPQSAIS